MGMLFGGWAREEQEDFEKSGCKSWAEFQEMKKKGVEKTTPGQIECKVMMGEEVCKGFILIYEGEQYYVEGIGENGEVLVQRVTNNPEHFYRGVYPHLTFYILKTNK
jgi:hypothetical protein